MATLPRSEAWQPEGLVEGTGEEVIRQITESHPERVVALFVGNSARSKQTARMLQNVVRMAPDLIEQREEAKIEQVINALLPEMAMPEAAIEEARMELEARREILTSGDFLRAAEVSRMAGLTAANKSAGPNRWKREGLIFAIQNNGDDYFPRYALDPIENYRPRKAVAEVLRIFGDTKSSWGIAFWFASLNSYLHDRAPKDLLARAPERVVAAARHEADDSLDV